MENVSHKAFLIFMLLVISFIGYFIYQEEQRPTFELKKDDWMCTETNAITELQTIYNGTSMTYVPVTRTVCVQWTLKNRE